VCESHVVAGVGDGGKSVTWHTFTGAFSHKF